jgi:hypothetical protein
MVQPAVVRIKKAQLAEAFAQALLLPENGHLLMRLAERYVDECCDVIAAASAPLKPQAPDG